MILEKVISYTQGVLQNLLKFTLATSWKIEMIPTMLAICFAEAVSLSSMVVKILLNASILWSGTDTVPWDKFRANPNQVNRCVGSHWDFSMFTTKPAYCGVVWTVALARVAAS